MTSNLVSDFHLSRLMLGTAQFGLQYGVANKVGQPTLDDVCAILIAAHEGGVNCLDTASSYGTSEEVLGQALARTGLLDAFTIVTKVYAMGTDFSSQQAIDDFVEESVLRSMRLLGLDVLPICLFHREENFRYVESLIKLRERGLVRTIGSSTVEPEAVAEIIGSGLAQAVQIPTNMLDQRFTRAGVHLQARQRGVALFVRSVYLQGLLLMPEDDIPADIADVKPTRRKLEALAAQVGISMEEMAIRYVLSLPGLTCALTGVDTVEQMRQNIELFSKPPLDAALVQAIIDAVPADLPENILKPYTWSTRMADIKPVSK